MRGAKTADVAKRDVIGRSPVEVSNELLVHSLERIGDISRLDAMVRYAGIGGGVPKGGVDVEIAVEGFARRVIGQFERGDRPDLIGLGIVEFLPELQP